VSGVNNISIGRYAAGASCGSNNFIAGACAGRCNTTGSCNIFIGQCAGFKMVNGTHNIALGALAAVCATFGLGNFSAGRCAGFNNTSGEDNTFIGTYSGRGAFNMCAFNNIGIGKYTGFCLSTGKNNIFLGNAAGCRTNTGGYNFYAGLNAGLYQQSGFYNIAIGHTAMSANSVRADHNIALGRSAGRLISGGCNNIIMGRYAGCCVTSGSNNILIGCRTGAYGTEGLANITTESNRIIMGNNAHTCAQIQIAWTAVSDCRDKCIYGAVPHGRGFLQNIEPIEYSFKDRVSGCVTDPEGKRRYGFSAQNVLAAEGDAPVVVSADNPDKLQITSDYMVPILVNAVNELSAEIEALKARIAVLESQ
jgi:hypothetical protein